MEKDFKYADLLDDDVFKLVFGQESSKDVMLAAGISLEVISSALNLSEDEINAFK